MHIQISWVFLPRSTRFIIGSVSWPAIAQKVIGNALVDLEKSFGSAVDSLFSTSSKTPLFGWRNV
ncbi:MAG TPA: hypothetical protein DEB28_05850 [Hyphomonas sp.]|uniref:Uncharacterized protein n=1 Tax=Hyphomonas atlantica TaxID=1280948 RepID=A0A059E0Z5_9PROT|nr:hypothetical protein HY36_05950 [Hyphomonas atlantica]HAW55773.1 hypothetical protein [Hyphomonas sp.]HBJ41909.1 hypothetical protein [Hyphomonas sp.]HBN94066.1 hypothetical protein [Hyphomonas sp.]HBT36675.1 hypothetical protein [Hyphomonas sp.]